MIKLIVRTHKPDKKMELYEFPKQRFIWVIIDNIEQHDEIVHDLIKSWEPRGFEVLITSTSVDEIMIIDGMNPENTPVELKVDGEDKHVFNSGKIAWIRIDEKNITNIGSVISYLTYFFEQIGFEVLITSDIDEVEIVNGDIISGGLIK